MRLETFLIADHAVAAPDGKLYVNGGGITRLALPAVPMVVPALSIVLRFLVNEEDVGEHMLALRLQNPEGIDLLPPEARPIEVAPLDSVADEEVNVQVVAAFGGLPIFSWGTHTFRVELDGSLVREMNVPVVKAPVPAALA